MLESLVAGLLNRTLGNYVENFDPKQLNIGIWSGDVTLKNLKLKKESLDKLELPIDVKYGFLGQLTLQIPWSNLRGKPVKVIIEDAYLLASPMLIEEYDEEKIKERELALKRQKLQELEVLEENKTKLQNLDPNDAQSKKQESFTESLLTKIVDNLQVTIKNIHLRYEDASVFTDIPYSLGVTLDELSAVSTDGSWVPSFVSLTNTFARKLLTLKSLSCYFNNESSSLISDYESINEQELIAKFKSLIAKEEETSGSAAEQAKLHIFKNHNFLLKPVSGNGKITVNKLGTTETDPHILSELFFKEFAVNLDSDQYRNILNTASNYRFYAKTFKFKKYRPAKSITPKEHPRLWFKYVANVVLNEIHEKNYKWSWEYMKNRRDDRKAYIKLFKQRLTAESKNIVLDADILNGLQELEDKISYEDIKFYRSLARTQFRKEKVEIQSAIDKEDAKQKAETRELEKNPKNDTTQSSNTAATTTTNKGWFGGWWSSAPASTESSQGSSHDENNTDSNALVMTEEQKQELFSAIEFDEQQVLADAIDIPKDRVKLKLFASLEKGSFRIRDRTSNLAEIMWEGCNFQLFERPHSVLSKFTLQEFKVEDSDDSSSLYKHIVSIKPMQQNLHNHEAHIDSSDTHDKEPFFQVSFESNPLDESADSKLMAKLKSMTIFYHTEFVEKIVHFFTPPKQHQDTISAIMNAAEATVEGLTTQTKLGLRYALEEHKTINTQLDLQAPLIILPLDPKDWKSPCGIIDAGHISVVSDLIDKNKATELKSKPPTEFSEVDWSKLNELMYDKFNLRLHDAQLLIGPTIKSTIEQLHDNGNPLTNDSEAPPALILKNFNTDFLLQISILPQAYNFTKFKVSGDVPRIDAKISDYQYKVMLQLLKKLIPEFEDENLETTEKSDDDETGDDSLLDVFQNAQGDNEFSDALSFIEESDGEQESNQEVNDNDDNKQSDHLEPERPKLKSQSSALSTTSDPLREKQHQFDFNFKVNVFKLSLYKCIDTPFRPPEAIIDLICENFEMIFVKTLTEINVDLLLSDVNFIDRVEKSGPEEFKKIISSNNFTQNDEEIYEQQGAKKDLMTVKYRRSQRIVELNNEPIELYDQDIKLNIAAVKAVINRRSLLTIYTYIMTTFTDPNAEETPADLLRHNTEEDTETAPQMISVTIGLERIILVLLDDHVKLATMQLNTGDVNVVVFPERLKVHFKLGALTLHDEINEGSPRDSISRKLVSIEGEDLAEVFYETYDAQTNVNLFSSKVEFKTGSMRVNLIEEPLKKIMGYIMNFLRMKSLFDSARDSNYNKISPAQIDDNNNNKMSYDILIKTPIIVFPKLEGTNLRNYDNFTAYLGEFRANNVFEKIEEKNGAILSKIIASLTSTQVTSDFYFDGRKQFLNIIDGIDMTFKIDNGYDDPAVDSGRPSSIISGKMSDSEIKLTEYQLQYLMQLVQTVPGALQYEIEDDLLKRIEEDAIRASITVSPASINSSSENNKGSKDLFHTDKEAQPVDLDHLKLDFKFQVGKLALSVYNDTKEVADVNTVKKKRLSRFSLNDIGIDFQMKENSHYVSNIYTRSFTVEDIRLNKDNLFTEIIPEVDHDNYQFMCKVYSDGKIEDKQLTFMLTVDSPKMILALDYLFALKDYAYKGFGLGDNQKSEGLATITEGDEDEEDGKEEGKDQIMEESHKESSAVVKQDTQSQSSSKISYTINIIDFSVILLSDPTAIDTEAIVLKLGQLLVSSQNTATLMANNVGSFLCRMNNFDSRLRIIDDFSASFAYDAHNSTPTKLLSNVQISIEPLVLRLSLSDIRLAINIINRAYELAGYSAEDMTKDQEEGDSGYTVFTKEFRKKLSKSFYASSFHSDHSSKSKKSDSLFKPETIIKAESLNADFEGLRLVILGDVHELPVIDMNVKQFNVTAENWSTNLDLNAQVQSYVNIFNYARSSWEPLVEPWTVAFHVSKILDKEGGTLNVDVISRDIAEVTLSARTITLLSQMYSLVSTDINVAPRGSNAPYTILNQTGYDIKVWIDSEDKSSRFNIHTIKQNETIPWQFEDWTEIRENLDVDSNKGAIAVELVGSPYKTVDSISLIGEGEELFMMNPPIQGVHNRLACSVVLTEDNVKQIVLKSTITVKNTSGVGILVGVGLSSDRGVNEVYPIGAGESFALPIDRVYKEPVAVKPDISGSSYNWSSSRIHWKTLYDQSASLECTATGNREDSSFYFQVDAKKYSDSARRIYPHLEIIISSPLQIENLLPYDMKYRIYDKTIRRSWIVTLKKGTSSNIHFVNLAHLLLLSVEPLNCGFGKSEFAIINSSTDSDFPIDNRLDLMHEDKQKLRLNIAYSRSNEAGVGIKVSIYSPYIILNRTGQNLVLGEKYNALHSIATSNLDDPNKMKSSQPKMFSFENDGDRKNRAFLNVADSQWSREISLDAIGQFFNLSMPVKDKRSEINVGVDIKEGEGKYLNTKVVTISPRFIITNNLSHELNINEIGSSNILSIKPGESLPLLQTCSGEDKELKIRYLGGNSQWSSPFSIKDIGEVFLKILKQNTGHVLLKVVVLLENATLFVRIQDAQGRWPYSIRNFSNTEFVFYQSNPYIDESGAPVKKDNHFKPIFYKIPPKSVMPYAWDYPAGIVKELVLRSHGKDRSIQLAEIGNLGVMHLPQFKNLSSSAVDINIVADGPTQALVISDSDPTNIYKTESRSSSSIALETRSKIEAAEDEHYSMRVAVNFKGLGLSLINNKLQELCYITFRGLEVKYNESELYQTIIWNLKWVQVDNQLFGGMFPIVIYPSVVPQSSQEVEVHPTFHFSISRVKDDSHGVLYVKYATLLLQEITIDIDEDFLFAILEFSKIPLGKKEEKREVLCEEVIEIPKPSTAMVGQDIYFEALHLQPTQINLSFVRTERVNAASNKTDSQNALMFFLNVLTMAIGNVNDAPIKLNALFIENIRVPIPILLHSIQTHYSQDFFFQLHKVLGSADFLGNPVGLFNNLSSGVMDIFYEPYQGLIMNDRPQELGISIAKGGLSFLKKSVFGVSDSVARFTGSVAKGLSLATLDKSYQERRRYNLRRNKPNHALVGFRSGATSFVDSISSGVSGIALAPIEGASSEGTSGFFKGIGKGIIGLPTKAAIGVFDLTSNISEGIRNTTTVFDNNALDKVRLPRVVGHDGIVRSYSIEEAQGQYWLKTINGGEFSATERYLAHMVLPGGELVFMITFKSIMLISITKLEARWQISYEEIKSIVLEKTGIKIGLFDNRPGPFIPIPDVRSKKFLYNRIAIAVNQYNRHCQSVL